MTTLAEIQAKLRVPKGHKNNFGNYAYRTASDILEAAKEHTTEPIKLSDELVLIGDRYYVKATASYGEASVTAYAREPQDKKGMDLSQITGAASTYARKYALSGLFAIDDSKEDPDSTNKGDNQDTLPAKKTTKTASQPVPKPKSIELKESVQACKSKDDMDTMVQALVDAEGLGKVSNTEVNQIKNEMVHVGLTFGMEAKEIGQLYKEYKGVTA